MLYLTSVIHAPVLVAIALTTTATGMLGPLLRDGKAARQQVRGLLDGGGDNWEFGPIMIIALVFTRIHSYPAQVI